LIGAGLGTLRLLTPRVLLSDASYRALGGDLSVGAVLGLNAIALYQSWS
jgi:hypothetical protein